MVRRRSDTESFPTILLPLEATINHGRGWLSLAGIEFHGDLDMPLPPGATYGDISKIPNVY